MNNSEQMFTKTETAECNPCMKSTLLALMIFEQKTKSMNFL